VLSLSFDAIPSDSITIAEAAKSATSTLESEFPVPFASNVLLVKVSVDAAVMNTEVLLS